MNKKQIVCLIIGITSFLLVLAGTIINFIFYERLGRASSLVSGIGGILGSIVTILSLIKIKDIKDDNDKQQIFNIINPQTFSYFIVLLLIVSFVSSLFDELLGLCVSFILSIISIFVYIQLKRRYGRKEYISDFTIFLTFIVLCLYYIFYIVRLIIVLNSILPNTGNDYGPIILFLILMTLPILFGLYSIIKYEYYAMSHYSLIAIVGLNVSLLLFLVLNNSPTGIIELPQILNETFCYPIIQGLIIIPSASIIYFLLIGFSHFPYDDEIEDY